MTDEPYRLRSDRMYNLPNFHQMKTAGRFDMPILEPCNAIPDDLIGFNYAKGMTVEQATQLGCHFYLDDYQFERCWRDPIKYGTMLSKFSCVLTPDFSLYMDMPESMKIWNTYRSRFIGAFWQAHGLNVIPTLQWASPDSFDYCFDGIPNESVVSASTVGVMNDSADMMTWRLGMREALERLRPSCVLLYGMMMPDFNFGNTNVICYRNHNIEMVRKWEEEAQAQRLAAEVRVAAELSPQ